MNPDIEALGTNPDVEGFRQVLLGSKDNRSTNQLSATLNSWFDAVLGTSLSIVAKKPLIELFIGVLKDAEQEVKLTVGRHAVETLRSGVAFFEEQDTTLRELLADAFTVEQAYVEAARVLQGIQLESSQRKISDLDRFDLWIRICRLYLEEDDTTTAETYLNRAKNLLYRIDDKEAQLKFKLSQARISDSQRRFLEAGSVYHEISAAPQVADDERDLTLGKAIVCAVLAPAGLPRTALLRKLYRDERAQGLEEYSMLESMYLGRLITPEQASGFTNKLDPHQTAQTADGSTVLAKAVIEHNLLGISKLYECISVLELAMLLGLHPDKADNYAARMIEQQRLHAQIDHVDGFIAFGNLAPLGHDRRFDSRIQLLLEQVEHVASLLVV